MVRPKIGTTEHLMYTMNQRRMKLGLPEVLFDKDWNPVKAVSTQKGFKKLSVKEMKNYNKQ